MDELTVEERLEEALAEIERLKEVPEYTAQELRDMAQAVDFKDVEVQIKDEKEKEKFIKAKNKILGDLTAGRRKLIVEYEVDGDTFVIESG